MLSNWCFTNSSSQRNSRPSTLLWEYHLTIKKQLCAILDHNGGKRGADRAEGLLVCSGKGIGGINLQNGIFKENFLHCMNCCLTTCFLPGTELGCTCRILDIRAYDKQNGFADDVAGSRTNSNQANTQDLYAYAGRKPGGDQVQEDPHMRCRYARQTRPSYCKAQRRRTWRECLVDTNCTSLPLTAHQHLQCEGQQCGLLLHQDCRIA